MNPSFEYRGRGGGHAFGTRRQSGARIETSTDLIVRQPMGRSLHTIHPAQIKSTISEDLKPTIKHCEYLTSYNWLEGKRSTILVPGSPPTWTPPCRALKLDEDKGSYYRDPNAARYPTYPVEPAIRALLETRPDFNGSAVDIVGCGSTFGSLLSACRLNEERTFVFGVERVGDTVFLVRQTTPGEKIENVRGYGHSFPDEYTTWPRDVKGSASHQRLIQYEFAGLRCIVRSESDGYLPQKAPRVPTPDTLPISETVEASLEDAASALTISHVFNIPGSSLVMKSSGQRIPQAAIFDLKTRSIRREVDILEFLPRLWVNQTPNFIVARHNLGHFKETDIEIMDVRVKIKGWEGTNKDVLLRFQGVLRKLIEITNHMGTTQVQVRRIGNGPLEITEPIEQWTVLPAALKARWKGQEVSDGKKTKDGTEDESNSDIDDDDYLKF